MKKYPFVILMICFSLQTIGCKGTPPTQRKLMPLTLKGLLGTSGTPAAKKHKAEQDKWDIPEDTDSTETSEDEMEDVNSVGERLVSFGGLFVGEFPEPWEITSSQNMSVVTLSQDDQTLPDVLIFTQRISSQIRTDPVKEIRTFQQLVDPSLGTSALYPMFELQMPGR